MAKSRGVGINAVAATKKGRDESRPYKRKSRLEGGAAKSGDFAGGFFEEVVQKAESGRSTSGGRSKLRHYKGKELAGGRRYEEGAEVTRLRRSGFSWGAAQP